MRSLFHTQVPDPMARYKQLLFYAAKLPVMTAEQHKPENKVEGCVSQVRVGVGLGGEVLGCAGGGLLLAGGGDGAWRGGGGERGRGQLCVV